MSPVKGRAHDCALKSGFPFGRRGVGPFRFAGAAPRAPRPPRAWAPAGAGAMKMASTTAAVMVKVEECFIVSSFLDSILRAGFPSSLLPTTRAPLRDRIRKMPIVAALYMVRKERSAITGRFVTASCAKRHPGTTVTESQNRDRRPQSRITPSVRLPRSSKRENGRSGWKVRSRKRSVTRSSSKARRSGWLSRSPQS